MFNGDELFDGMFRLSDALLYPFKSGTKAVHRLT